MSDKRSDSPQTNSKANKQRRDRNLVDSCGCFSVVDACGCRVVDPCGCYVSQCCC